MNEKLILILAGAAGVALGTIFFGGLWWTVRRGLASSQPALWFLGSALLRTAVVLAGFYFVSGGQWRRLVACLMGFFVARLLVARQVRGPTKTHRLAAENNALAPVSVTRLQHPKKS